MTHFLLSFFNFKSQYSSFSDYLQSFKDKGYDVLNYEVSAKSFYDDTEFFLLKKDGKVLLQRNEFYTKEIKK